jgi:acyl-CoA thioesterase-1
LLRKALTLLGILSVLSAPARAAESLKILALGDSLTAGYGLNDLNDSFPAQLEKALRAKGHNVTIVQGGISGDTSTDGRTRLEWSLSAKPDAVIVELGANDALRAIDPKVTEDNIRAIVARIKSDGTPVLLAGMLAPPNLGRDYGDRFNALFPKIAKESGVLLYPFFLDGVAAVPELNQGDHMHPNPTGVKEIIKRITPAAEKLVAQAEARRKGAAPPAKVTN